MKRAMVMGLVAMAFSTASSAMALAQVKKEASPGAVTSASTAMALPGSSSGSQLRQGEQGVLGQEGGPGQSAAMSGNAGVVDSNINTSEKARNN
jgi:hypothetical protein